MRRKAALSFSPAYHADPSLLAEAALEPIRALLEEGSIRGVTSLAVGSAIGGYLGRSATYVSRPNQGVIAAGRAAERVGPSFANLRAQVGALKSLGVDKVGRRVFFNGEVVSFETRSATGGVYGFVQNADGKLTSQLFSIADRNPASAVKSFLKFRNNSIALARAVGVDTLELQGVSVVNPRVAKFLTDQGFDTKSVPVPAALGGGYQDVMYKLIKVK